MPAPLNLKVQTDKKQSVFYYCKSLESSANAVSFILKQKEYFYVLTDKDVATAQANKAPVVWLVGHGLSKTQNIVDSKSKPVIDIKEVLAWCEKFGATDVVDSCCYPHSRLAFVKAAKPKLNYYCKGEDKEMGRIGNYQKDAHPDLKVLDAWWDGEKMGLAYNP